MARSGLFLLALAVLSSASPVFAQGGPPLITDDTETPGPGRWEVNFAVTGSFPRGRSELEAPLVDANLGWGNRIQLKLEMPWVVASDGGWQSGPGNPFLGIKWRFCDAGDCGVAVSFYPQVAFNVSGRSARKGLSDGGTSWLAPISFQGKAGFLEFNGEIGSLWEKTGNHQSWVAGLAIGHVFPADFELIGELFGETATPGNPRSLVGNVGCRKGLSRSLRLLFSAGGSLPVSNDVPRQQFYAGLQLTAP